MRWIFLFFAALLAAIGNAAIFESVSLARVVGGVAFNLFMLSLLVIWWFSYCSGAFEKTRGLVVGHALLMLSAGIGLVDLGASAALSDSCGSFISSSKPYGLRSQFVIYIQSLSYCREFGFGVVLLGLLIASPSIRLLLDITRRTSRQPTAPAEF